jgi:hypothetical protein
LIQQDKSGILRAFIARATATDALQQVGRSGSEGSGHRRLELELRKSKEIKTLSQFAAKVSTGVVKRF